MYSSATEAGGAVVLRVLKAPDSPMLNGVVGLGLEQPATQADVDEALAAIGTAVAFHGTDIVTQLVLARACATAHRDSTAVPEPGTRETPGSRRRRK